MKLIDKILTVDRAYLGGYQCFYHHDISTCDEDAPHADGDTKLEAILEFCDDRFSNNTAWGDDKERLIVNLIGIVSRLIYKHKDEKKYMEFLEEELSS